MANRFKDHDRLLRHSLLLLAATQVGNLAAAFYQIFLMRQLPRSEYGILAAMIGLIVIVTTPLDALRTAAAHYAARYCQAGSPGLIRGMVFGWGKVMAGLALALLAATVAGRFWLADFFQLPSSSILIMTGAVLAGSLFMPLLAGALQGMQAFGWYATSTQSWGVVRLAAGVALVLWVQASAMMALLGQGAGVLACLAIGWCGLQLALRGKPSARMETLAGGGLYFIKSLLVLAGYAVLVNADVCIVKHYFSPDQAGGFARAATIARSIIFLSMPIAGAMFPKVVSEGIVSEQDRRTLLRALGYAAGLVLAGCLGASLLAGPIWRVFVGQWPEAAELKLLRMILWAMSPLGLAYLMLNFELAQRRFQWLGLVVVCALAYGGGALVWHASLAQFVTLMAAVNAAALAALACGMPWRQRML